MVQPGHCWVFDQHAVLEKGMTIRDVLQRAFDDFIRDGTKH